MGTPHLVGGFGPQAGVLQQGGNGLLVAVGEGLKQLPVAVVTEGRQLTHFDEAVGYSPKGGEDDGEVVTRGVIALEYLHDAADAIGLSYGRASKFEHFSWSKDAIFGWLTARIP